MSEIRRDSIEDALENDRCGICGSVDHFREDCPAPAGDGPRTDTSALREEIARDLGGVAWEIALPRHRDRLRAKADDILALPTIQRLAERAASLARGQAAEELGEALGIATTRGPLEAVAWMARRHAALRTGAR